MILTIALTLCYKTPWFLYLICYPPFQRPTPSTVPPMLYHMLGPCYCKKSTVPYLPIRPLHFTRRGQKISSPTGVNLGPCHISETIRATKLKFYTHLHRVKYTLEYENLSARGVRDTAPPSVIWDPSYLGNY